MELFFVLLIRLIPLYIIIALGFFAGKKLQAQKESFASILIYILAPVIVFDGVIHTPITLSTLSIPIFFFLVCSLMCGLFYVLASIKWKDTHRNILAFTAGSGNTGYFGIPVTLVLFGNEYLGLTVLSTLGFMLYESTVGFYVTARGKHTVRESIRKILKLPTLYAFILAIMAQKMELPLAEIYDATALQFRGAYSVLGMMIIGLGIASIERFRFDWLFTSIAFAAKFVAWPLLITIVILIDTTLIHWFSAEAHKIMILMSIVPMAANTIVFATHLKAEPEKSAVAVLLSTLVALVLIPVVSAFFLV